MSHVALTISDAVHRLITQDPTLKWITLTSEQYTDEELAKLINCLLENPNAISSVCLTDNQLTDKTGIKLAHFLAISTTIQSMTLDTNQFGETTFLAVASALRVNSSLQYLYLDYNQKVNRNRVDMAFVDALMLNPIRSDKSVWWLYFNCRNQFYRLKKMAQKLGHPTMQVLLALQLVPAF